MTAKRDAALADLQRANVELQRQLDACRAELAARNSEYGERIEHQAATNDVLKVMSASPGDPQPVFDLITRQARELCKTPNAVLLQFDGKLVHVRAMSGGTTEWDDTIARYKSNFPAAPTRSSLACRAILDGQIVHIRDLDAEPGIAESIRALGHKTSLTVPMVRGGRAIGAISTASFDVDAFSASQIALLKTFAEQAVIAIGSAETYRQLQQRTGDLQESLEYQTATSDVLQVISRSTFDLQPVLDTLVETAARLCEADSALLCSRESDGLRVAATRSLETEFAAAIRGRLLTVDRGTIAGRTALDAKVVQIADITADPEYSVTETIRLSKRRTALGVPLVREGVVIGTITLGRRQVKPFTERQIELVRTFADQAVIAIENARLITETREALEQQQAIAEVLQVINASAGELEPVFAAMLDKAMQLCGVAFGHIATFDGQLFTAAAVRGEPAFAEWVGRLGPIAPSFALTFERLVEGVRMVEAADVRETEAYRSGNAIARGLVDIGGCRSLLTMALRKEDALLGALTVYRQEVRPFTERDVALLQNFADQAVIAMENARLITETQEALEQQTATAEVLGVINASPGDLAPVFDAMLEKALRLCGASFGVLGTYDGERFRSAATRNVPTAYAEFRADDTGIYGPGTGPARLLAGETVVHIPDLLASEPYQRADPNRRALVDLGGALASLIVPLLHDATVVGYIMIYRKEAGPFADKQIALLQNFAAQAVIAMDNARLLEEIRQRQAELRVTFDNMGDGVAMFDADMRLAAWNTNFRKILDLPEALLAERPTFAQYFDYLAARGEYGSGDLEAELRRAVEDTARESRVERTRPDGRVIEVRRNAVPGGGAVLIYSDVTERKRAEEQIRAARDAAEKALGDLKLAQANLVQAEKMASLGQLTAGIAHEIKNPLNFVNNFAGLSIELLDELTTAAAPAIAGLGEDTRAEIDETVLMLTSNLEKIAEHGRRADGIVRSMLEHSRGASGERRAVDLNALIEEALNLAYHGARAQDQSFNITLERDFAGRIAPIELVPQDVTRVFLNLFGNGFYAANKRAGEGNGGAFKPVLKVATRDLGDAVEVRVRDNGSGIPAEVKDKLFQPFFTTKPTGEGTGLGLSISYDIVTQQHGGTIEVDSLVGEFTEFTIRLPRDRQAAMRTGSA